MFDEAPDEWGQRALADVADISRGTSWREENEVDAGHGNALPVLGIKNVRSRLDLSNVTWLTGLHPSAIKSSTVRRGDILMVGSNGNPARIGNSVQIDAPGQFLFASLLFGLRPKEGLVNPEYLFHLIKSEEIQSAISDTVQGTTGLSNLKISVLRDIQIALPPLAEQQRIANVLRSVDEAVSAAVDASRQAEILRDRLIASAFVRERDSVSLGEICALIYRYPGFYGFEQQAQGVPVIRGEHLRNGKISTDWDDFYFVDPDFAARFPKTILRKHDVVMSVRGTVGTTAVVEETHVGSQISPNLIRLVADPERLIPPLLYFVVQSAVAHIRATIVNAQALPALNAGDIKNVRIALPRKDEQRNLWLRLEAATEASSAAREAIDQHLRVRSEVAGALLSGRLRVPA